MPYYRMVQTSFWTDAKIDGSFAPDDIYMYLYLLTNPHTTLAGCYEATLRRICYETKLSAEKVQELLVRLEQKHNVIRYSPATSEVLILNWHKYNWTKSPKLCQAVLKSIADVKDEAFRVYLTECYHGAKAQIQKQYMPQSTSPICETQDEELTDEEKVLKQNQAKLNEVHAMAEDVGFPMGRDTISKLDLLSSEYTPDAVLAALGACNDAKVSNMNYLRAVLKNNGKWKGGSLYIDDDYGGAI